MSSTSKLFRFAELSITAKLMLVVALPVTMMCLSFGSGLVSDWRQAEGAASIASIARIAPAFTQAAHELQKERGASALMLGAKGALFRTELQRQRSASDAALAQLQGAFQALGEVGGTRAFGAAQEEVESALSRVQAMRPQVDRLAVPASDMATQYTGAIARMIAMVQSIARIDAPSRIGNDAKALLDIAEAKERAGLERALAANGFAAGRFEPENYRRLVSLAAEQTIFIAEFRDAARQELVEKLNSALSSEQARAVDVMRQAAFGAPFGTDIRQISPSDWFDKATARIDLLKTIEDAAGAALVSDAEVVSEAATASFRRSLGIAFAALVTSVLAAFAVARSITKPMAALVEDTLGLARGDHDRAIAGIQRRDEIGEIASALLVFQENAARVRALEEQERTASAARLARAQSMEAVVSDVGDVVSAAA
ncbi:nitrate- and nitrite sensing domain-containing protein, partial [Bosea sp. TND4EK4]|uniref:nitrate- and nitrite sensing domain-containing protein n=1 Tax=Bosea sp. TND4EK4 TaxID=1907408 RepID=UPI000953DCE0